jgi:hypothetical protein
MFFDKIKEVSRGDARVRDDHHTDLDELTEVERVHWGDWTGLSFGINESLQFTYGHVSLN